MPCGAESSARSFAIAPLGGASGPLVGGSDSGRPLRVARFCRVVAG